jgi:hypothetical protein
MPTQTAPPEVVSLDALAEARYGYDRIATGSAWDDPVFDAVADRWSDYDDAS